MSQEDETPALWVLWKPLREVKVGRWALVWDDWVMWRGILLFFNIMCISAYYAEEKGWVVGFQGGLFFISSVAGFSGSDRSKDCSWFIYGAYSDQFGLRADLVGVTGDVLCEPERFGGQVFMCGSGRSGECFHVCTCEGTFHRVILGLRFCAFFKTGSLLCLLSQYYGFSFWGSGFWRCALCIYLVLWKVLGKLWIFFNVYLMFSSKEFFLLSK